MPGLYYHPSKFEFLVAYQHRVYDTASQMQTTHSLLARQLPAWLHGHGFMMSQLQLATIRQADATGLQAGGLLRLSADVVDICSGPIVSLGRAQGKQE